MSWLLISIAISSVDCDAEALNAPPEVTAIRCEGERGLFVPRETFVDLMERPTEAEYHLLEEEAKELRMSLDLLDLSVESLAKALTEERAAGDILREDVGRLRDELAKPTPFWKRPGFLLGLGFAAGAGSAIAIAFAVN